MLAVCGGLSPGRELPDGLGCAGEAVYSGGPASRAQAEIQSVRGPSQTEECMMTTHTEAVTVSVLTEVCLNYSPRITSKQPADFTHVEKDM